MGLIMVGGIVVPPPAGVEVSDMESLKSGMHLFEPQHFVFPFLAHALGTLVGALITSITGVTHQLKLALLIGVVFLSGGVSNAYMLPSPVWFSALDLTLAYIPMAYLGFAIATRSGRKKPARLN